MTERRRVPRRPPRTGAGGAVLFATLILAVLIVAVVAGFVTVRQLGAAAKESKLLFAVQQNLDGLIRVQLDEETALRGYLVTKDNAFLEPFLSATSDTFEERAAQLDALLHQTALDPGRAHLAKMVGWHQAWHHDVADPLARDPSAGNVAQRESYGKVLTDRVRTEADALRALVNAKNDEVENLLAQKIDRTVAYALGFVLIFALAALYLTIVQRSTAAALVREHSIAAGLQAALGVGWQTIPGCTIGTAYVSATREADVGGDLYDAWRLDDGRGAIIIADMSGKGVSAVVNTAFCKYSLRALLETHEDPADVMTEFNHLFSRTVSDPSMFTVAFLGVVDARARTLHYVAAGHEPAFFRRGAKVEQLQIGGPIIGMQPDSTYTASTLILAPGDVIVLATDGLTEARDASGELLGAHGARATIVAAPSEPQALCDALIETVRRRSGGTISDDLALLALRFDGGQPPPPAESA